MSYDPNATSEPKFFLGDLVLVKPDRRWNNDFRTGENEEAIVINGSGGVINGYSYTLYFEMHGEISWYDECQLVLISRDRTQLLREWQQAARLRKIQQSDLEWIFKNCNTRESSVSGASIEALALSLGWTKSLWGSRGEGITFYMNATTIMEMAKPFLLVSDLSGWLAFCETYKLQQKLKEENDHLQIPPAEPT